MGCLRDSSGFVLVLVISAIALLAVVAATFTRTTHAHIRTTLANHDSARGDALTEAAINLAVLNLLPYRADPKSKQAAFALGRETFRCHQGGNVLSVQARDEAGKIDLNFASVRLLRAFLVGLGIAADQADQTADTIVDFRDGDDIKRPKGAERSEYAAAGRILGPKNAPFATLEELDQVLDLDAGLIARMLPYVTAHSGHDGVDAAAAGPELVELLRRGDKTLPSSEIADHGASALPAYLAAVSRRNIFTIRAEALMASGARFAREAIVDISPRLRASEYRAYRVWRWKRVPSDGSARHVDAPLDEVPDCNF
jgi:general secretion pathway protein K